jgi:F-type H+-transporting ATPase subunit b
MHDTPATQSGTVQPQEGGGFPPFKTESFPSQLFWLVICFSVLFLVMWRVAGPRIGAVLAARKARIDGDIASAAQHKQDAEGALNAYNAALAEAKARAHKMAEENRKEINAEVEKSKQDADAQAKAASQDAESRIAAMRAAAAQHVTKAAQDAAVAIVGRLIGDTVSADEAAAAVKAVRP